MEVWIREEKEKKRDIVEETLDKVREENEEKSETQNERNRFSGRKVIYCNLQKDELTPENIIEM